MGIDQQERLASVGRSQRELRTIRAVERLGEEMSGINFSLAMLTHHFLGDVWQECADKIAEMSLTPGVEIREKKV